MIFPRIAPLLLILSPLLSSQSTKQGMVGFRNLTRGKPLPEIVVQDLQGKKTTLELKGDSPCILAFLRQDQEDSKLVLAMLQRLVLDPKAPRMRILLIGRKGSSTKAWTLVVKTLSHRISVYLDEHGAAKRVGTVVMPSLAILDAKGRLVSSFLLYEENLEKQILAVINHLLGKKTDRPGPAESKRLLMEELGSNAVGLEGNGKNAEALALRLRQAKLAGQDPRILAAIGRLQAKLGKNDAAIKALRQSLTFEDAVVVHVQLGLALLAKSKYAEARKELETALPMSPDKALVHYALARIARSEGHLDLALTHIKKALDRASINKRVDRAPRKKTGGENGKETGKQEGEGKEDGD